MEPVATEEPRPQQSQTSAATPASSARQVPVATLHQMHPSLLMASSSGDPEALRALLDVDVPRAVVIVDVPAAGETPNGGAAVVQETREHHQQAPAAAAAPSLLDGVTPLGDTAFHLVAKSGSVDCARVVGSRARRLLDESNSMGDTPLHCAARAGHRAVAAYLVGLARGEPGAGAGALLRRRNARGETALHEAVRAGSEEVVELLLAEDPELARIPASRGGASPLYLAILLRQTKLAEKLHDKDPHLSYSGPQGQNALHAAVVTGKEHVRKVLEWNQGLTALRDDRGSTPLHFAAALQGGSRRAGEEACAGSSSTPTGPRCTCPTATGCSRSTSRPLRASAGPSPRSSARAPEAPACATPAGGRSSTSPSRGSRSASSSTPAGTGR
ncbi:hypothetical protein PVAP13_8NG122001 [Panicum virgatum]|uniref:Uncharacterized protein n=1 Tax=Panicum virgatum TaxID=38727 RepID=A0A8T0PCF5_PANVG|nr:hypothetical protein PVAP13_8NG122001 [Panicum virgatum]